MPGAAGRQTPRDIMIVERDAHDEWLGWTPFGVTASPDVWVWPASRQTW
jgi:hypothetical protein